MTVGTEHGDLAAFGTAVIVIDRAAENLTDEFSVFLRQLFRGTTDDLRMNSQPARLLLKGEGIDHGRIAPDDIG